jgi:hypothetical protein
MGRLSATFGPWVNAMRNETKSMFAGSLGHAAAAALIGFAALLCGTASAQPGGKAPLLPAAPEVQPGNDSEFIVKPPAQGNPRLVKPAPPGRDPGLVKKPPADVKGAKPDDGNPRRTDPGAPSRQDDCRGTAEDCKQNSPR